MPKATATSHPLPAPEAIARRAYEIFEERGREPGHELEHWLAAETELAGVASAPGASEAEPDDEPSAEPVARRPARASNGSKRRPAERTP